MAANVRLASFGVNSLTLLASCATSLARMNGSPLFVWNHRVPMAFNPDLSRSWLTCSSRMNINSPLTASATNVQRSPEHPGLSNCVTCRRAFQVSGRRDCCLGMTESLHNVNIFLTLPQLHQIANYSASCRSVETLRPPEIVRQTPIQQVGSTQGRLICSELVPAQIDRFSHRCTTWQTAWLRQLQLL